MPEKEISYVIVHDQKAPFTVYSDVMTDFGSKPARNFVREFDTFEEAAAFVKKMEGQE